VTHKLSGEALGIQRYEVPHQLKINKLTSLLGFGLGLVLGLG